MYVSFKLCCEAEKQLKLHKKMRIVIPEWEKQVLDLEPELTYHRNYLQAVLKLNIIVSEGEDHLDLTVAEINQIPKDVKEYMEILCNENQILLKIQNHDKEMDDARKKTEANHEKYYFDLPNKGVMRICSTGTRIALGILSKLEKNRAEFKDDPTLRNYIIQEIKKELDEDFVPCTRKFKRAFHETLNPLGIWEEEMFKTSTSSQNLRWLKARSLDCRIDFW